MLIRPNSTQYFAKNQAGGKAFNLYKLTQQGVPVPEWIALGSDVFDKFCEQTGLDESLSGWMSKLSLGECTAAEASVAIEQLFVTAPKSLLLAELVAEAYEVASKGGMISVRSSAADEDGSAHSFAGQLSSYLYVDSVDDAYRYTLLCWASGFSERGLGYRLEKKLNLSKIRVAVIFQKMIDPDASGVMFTCDVINNNSERFLVSAVYGVGEGIVSGALDADNYWLDAQTGTVLLKEVAEKTSQFVRGRSGECVEKTVEPALVNSPALSPGHLKTLYEVGRRIVAYYGTPQDIEWALSAGKIYILQTRPVTSLSVNTTGYPNLWDNSNIVESYGGLTSPLSFSFALRNYRNVYVQFCEVLHVPHQVVKDMDSYLGNMLGCINGRVFYNLYNWYKLVGVLPGFKQNRQFMETMMGVGESLTDEINARIEPHPSWGTWRGRLRKFRTGIAFLYYHFFIQSIVDRFLRDFKENYESYRNRNYSQMNSDNIFNQYLEMENKMLGQWKAPIINDFLCMVHFGLLKKLTNAWLSQLDTNIQNDLLAGDGNYESAEPTKTLIKLAGEISNQSVVKECLLEHPSSELYERLKQSEHTVLLARVEDYIDRFGFRCMNEMKLEEIDLSSNPSFLFDCLKNYIRSNTTDLDAYEVREKKLRADSERAVRAQLKGIRKLVYFWVLNHARKAVRNRENTRFSRTRAYGVGRKMFHAMGEKLAGLDIIEKPEDIFFLTIEEVSGIHNGTLPVYDCKGLVALRAREYARYEELEPKIRFQSRGPVYWQNNFLDEPELPEVEAGADYDLKGLACCPGVVEGTVKVVHSPKDDLSLDGQILVCKRTDPGWVPLFPSASALLVERGSLLSHSAIVAREMGIPAVVGVKGLLHTLESGMVVRMDGSKGTIKILDANKTDPKAAKFQKQGVPILCNDVPIIR